MKRICLEDDQASRLHTFLLVTTKYRENEAAAWAKFAGERNGDGSVKFPNAVDNADFWKETIATMSAVVEAIDRAETV